MKRYRVDDIDFEQTPMSTFETKKDLTEKYNMQVKDTGQPILVSLTDGHREGRTLAGCFRFGDKDLICALATGLTGSLLCAGHSLV